MTTTDIAPNPAKTNPPRPLLERLGVLYFRRMSASLPNVNAQDAVYVINADERKALAGIVRGAVFRACLAGAASAAIAAAAEAYAEKSFGSTHANVDTALQYWGIVIGFTVLAAILEILFLYWDSLRAVHRMARAAGYDPFGHNASEEQAAVAAALARAALELPNPTESTFGVNPHREASKIKLLFASLLYKVKVSITNFAIKLLVRRIAGRALVRTWLLPFLAIPGTAAWNGIVCFIVLREARIRVMGPSAAHELISAIFDQKVALSAEARVTLVRAVASSIVRTEDLHPNLQAVLVEVMRRIEDPLPEGIDDSSVFLDKLGHLTVHEQRMALRVLSAAAIIDGRFSGTEKKLVREALVKCGLSPDVGPVERLRRAFVRGDGALDTLVRELFA
ncbi:MAG TPA: hypothetical protein PK156_16160 [Polyangium sp.]|nr:hypothetical protein [Polyangium sp.]